VVGEPAALKNESTPDFYVALSATSERCFLQEHFSISLSVESVPAGTFLTFAFADQRNHIPSTSTLESSLSRALERIPSSAHTSQAMFLQEHISHFAAIGLFEANAPSKSMSR
jgi:hypothetical protein